MAGGAEIFSADLLLEGIVTQHLRPNNHRLFGESPSSDRPEGGATLTPRSEEAKRWLAAAADFERQLLSSDSSDDEGA